MYYARMLDIYPDNRVNRDRQVCVNLRAILCLTSGSRDTREIGENDLPEAIHHEIQREELSATTFGKVIIASMSGLLMSESTGRFQSGSVRL